MQSSAEIRNCGFQRIRQSSVANKQNGLQWQNLIKMSFPSWNCENFMRKTEILRSISPKRRRTYIITKDNIITWLYSSTKNTNFLMNSGRSSRKRIPIAINLFQNFTYWFELVIVHFELQTFKRYYTNDHTSSENVH